jgi:hypothetical protein
VRATVQTGEVEAAGGNNRWCFCRGFEFRSRSVFFRGDTADLASKEFQAVSVPWKTRGVCGGKVRSSWRVKSWQYFIESEFDNSSTTFPVDHPKMPA